MRSGANATASYAAWRSEIFANARHAPRAYQRKYAAVISTPNANACTAFAASENTAIACAPPLSCATAAKSPVT